MTTAEPSRRATALERLRDHMFQKRRSTSAIKNKLRRPSMRQKGFTILESLDEEFTFKIGIIDFLTKYNHFKFIENQTKATIAGVDKIEISAID